MDNRINMCGERAYLLVVADKRHRLHGEIIMPKSYMLKNKKAIGKFCVTYPGDIIQQICLLETR
jgi:hypothetical protein